jgi:hypothetical protein
VYQQQQQEQQEQQQDAENPFLDPPFSRIKSFILCERMAFPEICSHDLYPGLRDKDGQRLWRSPLDHLQLGGICRV